MPIYEFRCDQCGKEFERLVFSGNENPESCPVCGSAETHKILSVFASASGDKVATGCSHSHSSGHT
jgi:putative FmdB family regulatory protein